MQIKSPTKILPAPQAATVATSKGPQRIIIKPSTGPVLGSSQLLQVSGAQPLGTTGQLHQINIPGKGVQFIRFMNTSQAETIPTAVGNVTAIKSQASTVTNKVIPVTTTVKAPGAIFSVMNHT